MKCFCFFVFLGILAVQIAAQEQEPPFPVIMAGIPRHIAATQDYDAIFAELADHHIAAFYPTFQYQEVPVPLSLGYETDFLPPCKPTDAAFVAMRTHDVKLVIPGELVYENSIDDPLAALIACAGDGMLAAVLNIDEPFGRITDFEDPAADVQRIYERVKATDPHLPVMMVHAPLPPVLDGYTLGVDEVQFYFDITTYLSTYADVVGFDIYPIPTIETELVSPRLFPEVVPTDTIIVDYATWLVETFPEKPAFMVLQGFSRASLTIADDDALYPLPTEAELMQMACQAIENGVEIVVWWGAGLLDEEDEAFWNLLLKVSSEIAVDNQRYCEH